ncbi:hypothetical protein NBRC116602_29890 [Hyphomicrobiales bacterium 4NK60-0047b]
MIVSSKKTNFVLWLCVAIVGLAINSNYAISEERVWNGDFAPEMVTTVGIVYKSKSGKNQLCTGVIIKPGKILTAGHCSCGIKSSYKVFLSPSIKLKSQKGNPSFFFGAPIKHPKYNCNKIDTAQPGIDIGLIKFNLKDFPENALKTLKTLPKVLRLLTAQKISLNQMTIVGYGLTNIGRDGTIVAGGEGVRRKAKVPVLSWFCTERWANSRGCSAFTEFMLSDFGTNGTVTNPNNRDTCAGDSGGPVFVKLKKDYYLVGITSRAMYLREQNSHIKCGGGGIYEVVGRNSILEWLNKNDVVLNLD